MRSQALRYAGYENISVQKTESDINLKTGYTPSLKAHIQNPISDFSKALSQMLKKISKYAHNLYLIVI